MTASLTMANRSKLDIKKISKWVILHRLNVNGGKICGDFEMTPGHHLNVNTCLLTGCDVDPLLKENTIVVPLLDPRACFSPNFPSLQLCDQALVVQGARLDVG